MYKGKYFSSPKNTSMRVEKKATAIAPCIHVSGSIRGMRKQFWGYDRNVVRIGSYYYLQPFNQDSQGFSILCRMEMNCR